MSRQCVLPFDGAGKQARGGLEDGFLDVFDTHMMLSHGGGVEWIADSAKRGGYLVKYSGQSEPVQFAGVCSTLKWHLLGENGAYQRLIIRHGLASSSKSLGTLIHRHVYHAVECTRANRCDCPVKTPDTINTDAHRLLCIIKDKGWIPIHSELAIVSHTIMVATRVDLVCWDPSTERFVLVSWKTGYSNVATQMTSVDETTRHMKPPLDAIASNARECNQAQLMLEYLILTKEYQLDIGCALVIYARCGRESPDEIVIDKAASWWWNRPDVRDSVWEHLKHERSEYRR